MALQDFIRAMPKVDLHVQFEGTIPASFIKLIADQTDAARQYKKAKEYRDWLELLQTPDMNRVDEIARETSAWVRHPEDIARAVYDLGVDYSKQNIRYAEIAFIPAVYTDFEMPFQYVLDAFNDGADRAKRGWGVTINWLLAVPRERPRKSDDIARWATSVTANKGDVVGLTLVGREDAQPVAQFRKAFATAEKKGLPRVTNVYSYPDADSFETVMDVTKPQRVTDAWGLVEDEEAMAYLAENDIAVVVAPSREIALGRIESVEQYPIRTLMSAGLKLVIGTGMANFYNTTLTDEWLAVAEAHDLTVDEVEQLGLNAVNASFAPASQRQEMRDEFQAQYTELRQEHLTRAD